jgi:acetolactate synthase-1/2/3 large subunit
MSKKSDSANTNTRHLDRRSFIKGAAVAPTVAFGSAQVSQTEIIGQREAGSDGAPGTVSGKPGSDFMVDVVKSLNIDYIVTNPAGSCRGLHESFVTYGGNTQPELLTATHEESAAAMAHAYYKVSGKPLVVLCHGTVGLQHAAMAVYNAWCDRAPVILMVGNSTDAATRRPNTPTLHTVQDPGLIVRDFTKWDDQPGSLQHFAESMVRAYKVAMTPPFGPVLICAEEDDQEQEIDSDQSLEIPRLVMPSFPQGDLNAVREAADLLANADFPVIVVDRAARTSAGMQNVVELAETLNALVVDRLGRMNMPSTHYLYRPPAPSSRVSAAIRQADVVLGLELTDYWGTVNGLTDNADGTLTSRVSPGTKLISLGVGELYIRANYQDFQRYQPVDIAIGADAETTLPSLIEAVRSAIPASRRAAIVERGDEARRDQVEARRSMLAEAAANAWDARPISSARLAAELWAQIKNEDWALVSRDQSLTFWPHRLWEFEQHHQFIGGPGGQGIGYGLPAAVGGALAHRPHGRLVLNLQNDGDFMYGPGVLWTAAHHRIPLLNIVYNNRAYHQEVMHMQRMAGWRQRGMENSVIGTVITDPNIGFAEIARGMGVEGIGPVEDPNNLAAAIRRGIEVVKSGEPAVIDVVTQPR